MILALSSLALNSSIGRDALTYLLFATLIRLPPSIGFFSSLSLPSSSSYSKSPESIGMKSSPSPEVCQITAYDFPWRSKVNTRTVASPPTAFSSLAYSVNSYYRRELSKRQDHSLYCTPYKALKLPLYLSALQYVSRGGILLVAELYKRGAML